MITTAGALAARRYFAQQIPSWAEAIAIGVSNKVATTADSSLGFEIARLQIQETSIDFVTNEIVYKATIPSDTELTIYEAGLWSSTSELTDSRFLTGIDQIETWAGGTWQTANARIGVDAYRVASAGTGTLTGIVADLSANSNVDKMSIAYYSAGATSIKVVLKTDDSNYFTATKAVSGTGYFTLSLVKTDFAATGAPTWNNITSVALTPTGGAVDFDGIRIDDIDGITDRFLLVARTVFVTPIVKTAGRDADIEYRTLIV